MGSVLIETGEKDLWGEYIEETKVYARRSPPFITLRYEESFVDLVKCGS